MLILILSLSRDRYSTDRLVEESGSKEWLHIELTDVATGDKFKISDFPDKPILLDSFAVWCPTCRKQQEKIKELKAREGDAIVHISLDIDPNEDKSIVKEHIDRNNFNWYFAVAPVEMTESLIEQFGVEIVNAPSAPVVLICEDRSANLLMRGVKSANQLKIEIDQMC